MNVLAIETACPPGTIALRTAQGQILCKPLTDARRTTETFAEVIRSLLQQAHLQPNDIQLVVVTSGPGSFTGLRIGVTAAKVFSHAVGSKLVGVNTLEVIAAQVPANGDIEVVLDAQRGELFAARFQKNETQLSQVVPTEIIHADEWIDSRADAIVTGLGLKKIVSKLPTSCSVVSEDLWTPSAETLTHLGIAKLRQSLDVRSFELAPSYFRKSAAEEKADLKRND